MSLEQQNIFSPRKDELIFEYVRKQYINSRIQNILNDKSIINEEELIAFIKVHIKDTYNYLKKVYKEEMGIDVPPPKLVLFDGDGTISGCGPIKKSNGPVYCGVDGNIYIHPEGLLDIAQNVGIYGDMGIAYIVAHEMAHHFQIEVGFDDENFDKFVSCLEKIAGVNYDKKKIKQIYSIWLTDDKHKNHKLITKFFEFWADYKAGCYVKNLFDSSLLEDRDLQEVQNAVLAVGDDRNGRFQINESESTHGTSAQRHKALKAGFRQETIYNSPIEDLFKILGAVIEPEVFEQVEFEKIFEEAFGKEFEDTFRDFDDIFKNFIYKNSSK